jgi:hypothetical protein
MRKSAIVRDSNAEFRRLMIYDSGDQGVYLFLYRSLDECPSDADYWYEQIKEAERHAAEFGVTPADWQTVPDPVPGCQDDRCAG